MKKAVSVLMLLFMVLSMAGCKESVKSEKKVTKYIQNLKTYSCDVRYCFKNAMDDMEYDGKQYFNKDIGYRLDLGEDRVSIYKGNYIYVEDKKAEKKYTLIKEFDEVYKYGFINEAVSLMTHPESRCTENYDSENDRHYIVYEFIIPSVNRNIARGVLYYDSITLKPEYEKIYDLKGDERVEIRYSNFSANEAMDEGLFAE